MSGLSDKQKAFCHEYIKDLNGARAAIRAGYAKGSATVTASRLLVNDNVSQLVAKLIEKRMERCDVNADFVLNELVACWNAKVSDLFDDRGELLPISDWPDIWQKMVSGLDVKKLYTGYGDEQEETGRIIKIVSAKKERFLELIGKHVDVSAFEQRVNVTIEDKTADRLSAAKQRVRNSVPSDN